MQQQPDVDELKEKRRDLQDENEQLKASGRDAVVTPWAIPPLLDNHPNPNAHQKWYLLSKHLLP
jgi:hypothetical protein